MAVRLFAVDSLDVDDIFEAVDGRDLALATFVRATGYKDLIVFANGN